MVSLEEKKNSRDFQLNQTKEKLNESLLTADLSIKTNINKLVFIAHADPAVINATINISQSFSNEQNAWTFRSLSLNIYFYALLSVPFCAYSNTLTLFMTSLFTRLNKISIICVSFLYQISYHEKKRAIQTRFIRSGIFNCLEKPLRND